MGRARILFACAHPGFALTEGWQECKIALANLFLIVRNTSPVMFCVSPCLRVLICLLCCLYFFRLSDDGMGDKSSSQQPEWAGRIADLFRERGSAEEWPEISRAVARTLGIPPTPPSMSDIRDKGLYLDCFAKTLDYAISPHKTRHPLHVASGINDKARAWGWPYAQVRTGVRDPQRSHQDSVGASGVIFAQLFDDWGLPSSSQFLARCGDATIRNAE